MLRRLSHNRLFFRASGQILTWLAIGLFVIQTLGGAHFLARQLSPADPFASLALQYLCSPTSGTEAGKATSGNPQQGPASLSHDHCLLCRGGWVPFTPLLPLLLIIALAVITLRQKRPAGLAISQAASCAHRSRAPPLFA